MLETASAATDLDLIRYLTSIPDARMPRGVRFHAWVLLLVAVNGILSGCKSLRDQERFAIRHYSGLNEALGQELRRPPSDSSFRYSYQVDEADLCQAIRDWTIAKISGGATDLDQLVCESKTLRVSIEPTAGGGLAFIAQLTLDSAALAVVISQACYAFTGNHEQAVLRQLLSELDLEDVLIQEDVLHTQRPFWQLQEQGADFLLTVKANQKTLNRQMCSQFQGKRNIPFMATDHEVGHGRDITWTLRVKQAPENIRDAWSALAGLWKSRSAAPVRAIRCRPPTCSKATKRSSWCDTSLRTTPGALLQLVRVRWSIEGWHWILDTQLHEDAHRYRGDGAGVKATLRTAALNLLRLAGCCSIRTGLQAVMPDVKALLAMVRRNRNQLMVEL